MPSTFSLRRLWVLGISLAGVLAMPMGDITHERRAGTIDQATFNELAFYFQYASSAYESSCARPNGNTLVVQIDRFVTNTQAYIARDDNRREIVVALRGSTNIPDILTDASLLLVPFVSPGVKQAPFGSLAHAGFLTAWNSVADQIISTVRTELAAHPDYNLVTSGHSLGGALSSLAGISLQQNFPEKADTIRMFTY
ncbi:hypothetical protein PQX77_009282, partial [Marasmius sp. AFHP31]